MALLSVKMFRSLGTSEITESQLGPVLPPGAEVGPVPVWKSPSSPVKHGRSCWLSVVLPCSSEASGTISLSVELSAHSVPLEREEGALSAQIEKMGATRAQGP
jgi:hypothetical protein